MRCQNLIGFIVIMAIYQGGSFLNQNSISINIWALLPQPTAKSAA